MKRTAAWLSTVLLALPAFGAAGRRLGLEELRDKIRGGWAGQAVGCTFGGPVEFVFQGTIVPDYLPLVWDATRLPRAFRDNPGLYDDVYMDLTFLDTLERRGLEASAAVLARAFAAARYPLWHANQAARYNVLHGLLPPESGHWRHNPHADDIDFEIEADFAGLICPGLPNAAARFADRVGHIMNSGDGFYGGLFVAALYSQAFIAPDIPVLVREALKVVPAESTFARVMTDVVRWHDRFPDDWKEAWFRIQRRWAEDVGCPEGVFRPFDIDAKINCAWVLLGLLYGRGDFGRTLNVSARAGDDADCNPATAGGVLGTWLGFSRIPDFWKQGLASVENVPFKDTPLSLADASRLSLKQALQVIRREGGTVADEEVELPVDLPRPVPLEVSFPGHYPTERRRLGLRLREAARLEFDGIGFAINGETLKTSPVERVLRVEVTIDGRRKETVELPTASLLRRPTPFWAYELAPGRHRLELRVLNPSRGAEVRLDDMVIYGDAPPRPAAFRPPPPPGG